MLQTHTLPTVLTGQDTINQAMEEAAVEAVEEAVMEEAAMEEAAMEEAATEEAATEEDNGASMLEPFDVGVQCYLLPTSAACKGRNVTVRAVLSKTMFYVQLGNSSRFQNVPRERLVPIRAPAESLHDKQRKEKERERSCQRRAQLAQQLDWTPEEDKQLLDAMAANGMHMGRWPWSVIRHSVHGRSSIECSTRWYNHLRVDPEASEKCAATLRLKTQRPSRPAVCTTCQPEPSPTLTGQWQRWRSSTRRQGWQL